MVDEDKIVVIAYDNDGTIVDWTILDNDIDEVMEFDEKTDADGIVVLRIDELKSLCKELNK